MTAERPKGELGERSKILSLKVVAEIVKEKKKQGEKIGLVTGCFDIVHLGHIIVFRQAKQHVDVLIIGVEMDETILISKGHNRPVNNLSDRCEVLAEMFSVDLIFPTEFVIKYGDAERNDKLYEKLYKKIKPDFLITDIANDDYWKEKEKRAAIMGIGFLGFELPQFNSSTAIAQKIQEDF